MTEFESDYENSDLFIPVFIHLPEHTVYRNDEHFSIYKEKSTGHYYWEGRGDYQRLECDEAYTESLESLSDCLFWLHRYSGCSYDDSQLYVSSMGLPAIEQDRTEPDFIVAPSNPMPGKAPALTPADQLVLVKTICTAYVTGDAAADPSLELIAQAVGVI